MRKTGEGRGRRVKRDTRCATNACSNVGAWQQKHVYMKY